MISVVRAKLLVMEKIQGLRSIVAPLLFILILVFYNTDTRQSREDG